jgi:hypothetical protein
VHLPQRECLQHQHVERPLRQFRLLLAHIALSNLLLVE